MSKKTEYFSNALKMLEYKPQVIIEGKKNNNVDVGYNLAKTLDEIHKKAMKEYYTEQLRKAQLEETREVARQAVLDTIAQLDLSVSIDGEIMSNKIAEVLTNGINGGKR